MQPRPDLKSDSSEFYKAIKKGESERYVGGTPDTSGADTDCLSGGPQFFTTKGKYMIKSSPQDHLKPRIFDEIDYEGEIGAGFIPINPFLMRAIFFVRRTTTQCQGVGIYLKANRNRLGWSIEQLAMNTKVSANHLKKLEADFTFLPGHATVRKLAKFFRQDYELMKELSGLKKFTDSEIKALDKLRSAK